MNDEFETDEMEIKPCNLDFFILTSMIFFVDKFLILMSINNT